MADFLIGRSIRYISLETKKRKACNQVSGFRARLPTTELQARGSYGFAPSSISLEEKTCATWGITRPMVKPGREVTII